MQVDAAKYGPWAVIAGGSEGIGPCLARHLAEAGINLVLIARKPEPLENAARELRAATGVEVRTLGLDLTAPDMLDRVRDATGEIDVGLLIYNAGASHTFGPTIDWQPEDIVRIIRLNVEGQAVLAHHFARKMAERGSGGIVLMGSLAGVAGSPGVVPYAGAKAFSQIYSEGLWWEMRHHGVDVLHVVVGQTDTPAMERLGIVYPEGTAVGPEAVARVTLENLANGPVVVMPEMQEGFEQFVRPDRRNVVETNASFILGNLEGS
ncbi:MAG: SDR family NAD(P)-dependent oxidoreductase [Novosphingobium sp.]|nr:SDR family NAD(P)-dependent oxidoreductase [Erythrobacter sp.]MCB2076417.1 SDR family NAD(P)-dependent oxidoreductase [Novosphingobium sp.]